MRRKILAVIGTRPQIIKVDPTLIDVLINTSQHFDNELAGIHFKENKIKPKYNLNCSSDETGLMIDKIRPILKKEKPDVVVVYGDTNSTLAGTIAAAYENIPIAHIEAGLRSGDMTMKEEVNRIVADRLSFWKFCPTKKSIENLYQEGLGGNCFPVGDMLFDSMCKYLPIKRTKDYRKYVFMTIHREENDNEENLKNIIESLESIKMPVIFPIHPRTHRTIKKYKINIPKNVKLMKPIGRKETLSLINNAKFVITDSGGVVREAYWSTVHSFVVRGSLEWSEIIEDGWATLVPAKKDVLIKEFQKEIPHQAPTNFPRGGAQEKIKQILHES